MGWKVIRGQRWRLALLFLSLFAATQLVVALFFRSHQPLVWFTFYTAVSNFAIPWLPHEPIVLLYGTLYPPLVVALVGGFATCWMEFFNYRILAVLADLRWARSVLESRSYRTAEGYFKRLPFLTLVLAGATPVPYAPFRVLAVTSGYSQARYMVAVFAGRTPRYYLLALTGKALHAPFWAYLAFFAALVLALYWNRLASLRKTQHGE